MTSCYVEESTRWIQLIPIKVNVSVWSLSLDMIPSRINLSSKGLEISYIMCRVCNLCLNLCPIYFLFAAWLWRSLILSVGVCNLCLNRCDDVPFIFYLQHGYGVMEISSPNLVCRGLSVVTWLDFGSWLE